jgi:uncharacterized protein (DUF1800 family)
MKRRTLLQATGALAAASTIGALAPSSSNAAARKTQFQNGEPPVGFRPLQTESNDLATYSGAWTDDTLRHLLRRSMFGVPQAQFEAAKALGSMSAVIDKLLTVPTTLPTINANWVTAAQAGVYADVPSQDQHYLTDQNLSEADKAIRQIIISNAFGLQYNRMAQVANWWFDLIVKQDLSILEKMTLLWTNHFVTGSSTVERAALMHTYLNTCRQNALGNFKTFTAAIAIDPAMLMYLNGNQNKKKAVNENFARELMELFTLGLVDPTSPANNPQPNYTETDVQEAAKALTGWTTPDTSLVGVLNPKLQDMSIKTFLGQSGNWALQDIIDIIFSKQPYDSNYPKGYVTAYFASTKIYQALVYYMPNAGVVDAMARVMVQNNFEIAPVVRALLSSAHFYDANVIGSQLKGPVEYMGSLVREFAMTYSDMNNNPSFNSTDPLALATKTDWTTPLDFGDPNPTLSIMNAIMTQQGQQLLNPPNVKGWAGGHNWISTATFANREIYSYAILNNALVNRNKKWNLAFDPDTYAAQVNNATALSSDDLSLDLENVTSTFKFGTAEGGDLNTLLQGTYLKPNYKYNTGGVKNFAIYLTDLPEFQLF